MKYFELDFKILPCEEAYADVLAAMLAEVGCDSFEYTEYGLKAYVPQSVYDGTAVEAVVDAFMIPDVKITYEVNEPESRNWNEEWERTGFEPIVIDGLCTIHASYHEDLPRLKYDIVINPRMAFGSGTHETTSQLVELLLKRDMTGQTVLDMGCGTCILGIAMMMAGADECVAIDIDEDSVVNSLENCRLNGMGNVDVRHGDASILQEETMKGRFGVIVANIHKNIIINDMPKYAEALRQGGTLLLSGFYTEDIPTVRQRAEELGLSVVHTQSRNNWAVVAMAKN